MKQFPRQYYFFSWNRRAKTSISVDDSKWYDSTTSEMPCVSQDAPFFLVTRIFSSTKLIAPILDLEWFFFDFFHDTFVWDAWYQPWSSPWRSSKKSYEQPTCMSTCIKSRHWVFKIMYGEIVHCISYQHIVVPVVVNTTWWHTLDQLWPTINLPNVETPVLEVTSSVDDVEYKRIHADLANRQLEMGQACLILVSEALVMESWCYDGSWSILITSIKWLKYIRYENRTSMTWRYHECSYLFLKSCFGLESIDSGPMTLKPDPKGTSTLEFSSETLQEIVQPSQTV